jgi:GNAT superfamily N-acetyltransferase
MVALEANNTGVRFRRVSAEDSRELTALVMQSKAVWGYSDAQMQVWRPGLEISVESLGARPACIAEVDGRIAGFYTLIESGEEWDLEDLWVFPDYMRSGIGRALLKHAADVAAAGGATSLRIESDPHAERFYIACGATRIGTVSAPIDGEPGRVRPVLRLSLG